MNLYFLIYNKFHAIDDHIFALVYFLNYWNVQLKYKMTIKNILSCEKILYRCSIFKLLNYAILWKNSSSLFYQNKNELQNEDWNYFCDLNDFHNIKLTSLWLAR